MYLYVANNFQELIRGENNLSIKAEAIRINEMD